MAKTGRPGTLRRHGRRTGDGFARDIVRRTRDWREALALAPPDAPRAALALAAAGQEPDPTRAAELERQAFAADPAFAPAALAHARRHAVL